MNSTEGTYPEQDRENGHEALIEMCRQGISLYLQALDEYFQSQGKPSDSFERRKDGINSLAESLIKTQLRLGSPESANSKLQLVMIADNPDDKQSYAFQFVPNSAETPALRAWEQSVAEIFRQHQLPYLEYSNW